MKKLLLAVFALFALSSCTPQESVEWFAGLGFEITEEEGAFWADHWNERDCLPSYVHSTEDHLEDQYFECAILDSALRFGINLDDWARISWCETSKSYEDNDPSKRRLIGIDVYNDSSGASGAFQQMPRFWQERQERSGYYGDIFNPRINAFVSGWLFAEAPGGGPGHWAASRHCHGVS